MGNLKPIGSEKLQGMDKINRILEIARYKENKPNPINEDKSVEYRKTLSDNNNYQIVKEKNGYVITKAINESEFEYIEPMKNRKYYSSYSQAMKRLNLIAKEVNTNVGYDKNVSLFYESDDKETKYVLKVNANEQAPPAAAPVPEPAPSAATPSPAPAPSPEPAPEEMPTDELPEPEMDDTTPEDETDKEEVVTFKTIQKLTGKLAQKIRTLASDEENKMSSKDIKYVINSILSALDLNSLEPEDKEQIMAKFEGEEDMGDMEGDEETSVPDEEMPAPEEVSAEVPPAPEGEMAEETDEEYTMRGARKRRRIHPDLTDDESDSMSEMIEGLFSESKVDSILQSYFKYDKKEKQIIKEQKEHKKEIKNKIKNISENIVQEVASLKFVEKNPKAKLLGKTLNKTIVFEQNNKRYSITPKGQVL